MEKGRRGRRPGYVVSDETKKRLSEAAKASGARHRLEVLRGTNAETGERRLFVSRNQAARQIGASSQLMKYRDARGGGKWTLRGWTFEYVPLQSLMEGLA